MPAETAAPAAGVTAATESNDAQETSGITTEHEEASQSEETAQPSRLGERANALLEEMGISEEVRESLKPKGKTDAEKTETEKSQDASDTGAPEGADAGHAGGKAKGKENAAQGPVKGKEDEEKPLTEEQTKGWPPEALARIHKATAQKNEHKTARAEAERKAAEAVQNAQQLHQQLQHVTRARPQPTEADPLGDVLTLQDLQARVRDAEEMIYFAEANPDGKTNVPIGKDAADNVVTRDFSAQEMAAIRAEQGRILRQHVPAKAAWLQEAARHEALAREKTPELFDPETDEYKATQQLFQNVPELFARLPGALRWVGWAMRGRTAELAENKAAAAVNGNGKNGAPENPKVAPFLRKHPRQAPSVPTAGGSGTTERKSKDSARKETVEQFANEGGDDEALERMVERTRNQQRAPEKNAALV